MFQVFFRVPLIIQSGKKSWSILGHKIMTRCIFARYTTVREPDDQQFYRGPSNPTGHGRYVSSDLKWVKDLDSIVRLDISCNYLNRVDLTPLSDCQSLKYLDLSENAIEDIDLSSLSACDKLETLDISYNRLNDVNLTPLVHCKSLRFVYIHRNQLDTINIAPLNHLKGIQKVVIDNLKSNKPIPVFEAVIESAPPNLNDVLYAMSFQAERPPWLQGVPTVKIIRLNPKSYRTHVEKHGWDSVKKHMRAAFPLLRPDQDFLAQKAFLNDIGIPELACYDGSISDIIEIIPTSGSYEDGMLEIQTNLIALLSDQLDNGGSTLFFDIDELSTTPGSVLVPQIVSKREKELRDLVLYHYESKVNLMPMWLTGFGFSILQAAKVGRVVQMTEISKLLERYEKELGIVIPLEGTKSRKKFNSIGTKPSDALLTHVRSIVHLSAH